MRTVTSLGRAAVKVGVVGDKAADEEDGITIARLAGVHEYGAAIQQRWGVLMIPERSFIRSTVAANNNYASIIPKLAASVLDGKRTEAQALGIFGAKVSADMKATIARGIKPDVADSTQEAKGPAKTKPLINTGRLINAITWDVVPWSPTRDR